MAVFYSFHYDRDSARVQQVINMGVVEGQPVLNSQDWEKVRQQGRAAIEAWIAKQMLYKTAVVVLVGAETSTREWVTYEISKAWNDRRGLVGIRIHGLAPFNLGQDRAGANPFANVRANGGTLAGLVPLYTPSGTSSTDIYASIKANLTDWVGSAYKQV